MYPTPALSSVSPNEAPRDTTPKPASLHYNTYDMPNSRFAIAILAAGKGTRLKSKLPKVLHQIAGRPLLGHVVRAASSIVAPADIFCIIGHEAERVRAEIAPLGTRFIEQLEQRGTGHALMQCRQALAAYDHVLVLSGDVPLIRPETIAAVRDFHIANAAAMTILTAEPARSLRLRTHRPPRRCTASAPIKSKPSSSRSSSLPSRKRSARSTPASTPSTSPNCSPASTSSPPTIRTASTTSPRLPQSCERDGKPVLALRTAHASEVLGVNTRRELAQLDSILRERKTRELMDNGVTIYKPETVLIDCRRHRRRRHRHRALRATARRNHHRPGLPHPQLFGAHQHARRRLRSASTTARIAEDSIVGEAAIIGPYSRIRPGSEIGPEAHVGNFVETKKAKLGRGAKANHLTYLGDAEIGERTNIGAGTITCNYDGVNKHRTVIGAGAFIGSDTTLVAPVRIGDGAYVGAASCITKDVPDDSLGLTRPELADQRGMGQLRSAPSWKRQS